MPKFFEWWFSQLASMVPAAWKQALRADRDALIIEIDRETVRILARRNGERTRAGEFPLSDTGLGAMARLIADSPALPRHLVLRLPPSQVLRKHVALPAGARRHLEQALGFEIGRETPFEREEVYWNYSVLTGRHGANRLDVELCLVPRSFIDPLLGTLRSAGVNPSEIETDSEAGGPARIGLGAKPRVRLPQFGGRMQPLAALTAVLAALLLVTPLLVEQWVFASADGAISSLTGPAREAATLRQIVDKAANAAQLLLKERGQNGGTVATLAAITDALPDDTYLTALSLRDGKITMSGFSASAADLIRTLADAEGFTDPAFAAPVVQNPNSGLESFTISANLAPQGAP